MFRNNTIMIKFGARWGALGIAMVMMSVGCGDSSGMQGAPLGPNMDGGQTETVVRTPVGEGPFVISVAFPAGANDTIPLQITLFDTRADRVKLVIELSLDGGSTWRPARVSATDGLPADSVGKVSTVSWDSVKDVGFHAPRSATLRLTPSDAQGTGVPYVLDTPVIDNLRAAARRVDYYLANYGRWTPDSIQLAKQHQLVIVHPRHGNMDRGLIAEIQAGMDPNDPADDVIVLGYVSVGEDLRTGPLTDAEIRSDKRFAGDRSGPRIDPRGPGADGMSLQGIDPRGLPSNGGTGFASYYLDDNSVNNDPNHVGDGFPDRNAIFGSLFVNAGDPKWFETVDAMLIDGPDQLPGIREIVSTDYGRGLGCNGVFLDTIDTAAPNSYTNASSPNESKFEWTAPGFAAFMQRLRKAYPNRLVLQNRGLFFFDPRHPQYEFTTRGSIDFAFFESYRLNSNPAQPIDPYFYPDNRYNFAPKMMAEANRPDGFRVLSLGYAEAPSISKDTLLGKSTVGFDSLMEDIHVTQELAGFRHYISDPAVELLNTFVKDHANLNDTVAPVWTSTYNDTQGLVPLEPTPRIGIQEVVPGPGQLTVRWDVALDMNVVHYALYYQTLPFDFANDPQLKGATRVVLVPKVPAEYLKGVGPGRYPYEATLAGLTPGVTYQLLIRAFDGSPAANEDANTVVLSATPTN
jgi:hypothetical protein